MGPTIRPTAIAASSQMATIWEMSMSCFPLVVGAPPGQVRKRFQGNVVEPAGLGGSDYIPPIFGGYPIAPAPFLAALVVDAEVCGKFFE